MAVRDSVVAGAEGIISICWHHRMTKTIETLIN